MTERLNHNLLIPKSTRSSTERENTDQYHLGILIKKKTNHEIKHYIRGIGHGDQVEWVPEM